MPNHDFPIFDYKSGTRGVNAYIRFINNTDRVIEIVWISYSGSFIKYRELKKDNFVDVNTYDTHLWIAFDYYTKDRLLINKEFVYHPIAIRHILQEGRVISIRYKARIPAHITIPLFSLRYLCLLNVRNFLKTPEEADRLELPKRLIEDLKKAIRVRNNMINTLDSQSSDSSSETQ